MSKEKKILIVDDQYGIRALLTLALAKYNLEEAADGQRAIELATTWEPDLIIIDMKMPILSGADTITSLKKMNFKAKILLMTAYDDNSMANDTFISGFIGKPFDLHKLIAMVDNLLE